MTQEQQLSPEATSGEVGSLEHAVCYAMLSRTLVGPWGPCPEEGSEDKLWAGPNRRWHQGEVGSKRTRGPKPPAWGSGKEAGQG